MTVQRSVRSETSAEFLSRAQEHLTTGDLSRASEKGWGAAAQKAKAIAEQRGWRHQSHGDLFQIVKRLATESADPELHALFHSANALHQNFYEGLMPCEGVAVGIEQVTEFVRQLDLLGD